jgi:cytochrome c-type biogenesis protein CcmH
MLEEARANRPSQADAEAQVAVRPAPQISGEEVEGLMTQLRTILVERPNDLRGHRLLMRNEAGLGNMVAAYGAQERVIAIIGPDAPPTELASELATLAELKVLAAGGYVSPEAEGILQTALERDPRNGTARYYMGLMYAQAGRFDLAWPTWRRLLADSTPDAPWLEPILLQIEDVSALAGDPTPLDELPIPRAEDAVVGTDGLRGPSEEDMNAAAEMSMQERLDMVQGMVQGLAERLASEGGPPEEWARLITSLGVLGNTDAAFGVYSEAILVFEGNRGALDMLDSAADQAGVNPG